MTDTNHQPGTMINRHRKVAVICSAVVVGMVSLAYASVPLYRLFCQVTADAEGDQRCEDIAVAGLAR